MTPPRLIGIAGYARSGKSTVATAVHEVTDGDYVIREFKEALQQVLLAQNPLVHKVGHVEYRLVEVVEELGWDGAKDAYPEVRRLMIDLGTKGCRQFIGDDVWLQATFRTVGDDDRCVFTDCRFPNEAKAIKRFGGQVWRIERPGFGPINGHPSEHALDDFPFDRVINNDATPDALRRAVLLGD